MTGRFGAFSAVFLAFVAVMLAESGVCAADPASGRPPNFVVVLVDDLGYGDFGAFGSTKHRTPVVDRMAKEGMRLTDFYSVCSVCTPSRAGLMTGCYPRRVNMHVDENNLCVLFPGARKGLNPDEITIAEVLKGKGYATGCFGKWHLGDHPNFLPTRQGFDEYFGIPYSNDMDCNEIPLPLVRDASVIEAPVEQTTITQRLTEEAVRFIKANKSRPFFVYLPHTAVHLPLHPGAAFKGKSQDGPYGDWVEEVDWSMGELFRTLKAEGIDQDTLVLITSDNGSQKPGSNDPLRGLKGRTDEGGMRMPCIVRWPGKIPAGSSSAELTATIDILPTLAALAGTTPPQDRIIDGRDIGPILRGQAGAKSPHEAFYYYQMDQLQAVRSGPWKLFVPMESKKRNWGKPEGKTPLKLFNLAQDIHEDKDVADANPEVVARLLALAEKAREDLGDVDRPGKGQRPAGWVDKPSPRLREGTHIQNLRCEYRQDPLGIDAAKPRLSWVMASDRRGERQTAYRVLVATAPEMLAKDQGDLWDSGKVQSDRSNQVEYAGKPLGSQMRCYWKVCVWDKDGEPCAWSKPAFWSMGLLEPSDWQARWIGYDAAYRPSAEAAKDDATLNLQGLQWVRCGQTAEKAGFRSSFLRKRFELPEDRKVRRATLALYAFNECHAKVNGKPVGFAAHWERTARLDATEALKPGANCLTLSITHTDDHRPAAIGRLVIQFDAGADLVVPIDNTWKAANSAAEGWEQIDFDDQSWPAAEAFGGTPWKGPPQVADLARLPAPYLRKDFSITQEIKRATVYVTALGTYELRLNGQRVGHDVLQPGWTEFRKRVHYQTYDVTPLVSKGENAIGAILGDGWYASDLAHLARRNFYGGKPRLLAQLVIELADGSKQVVATDDTWKAAFGPIRHADLLMGCEYDARQALSGWDSPRFDAGGWQPVDAAPAAVREGVADVTALVKRMTDKGRVALKVENEALGGDPAYGTVKALRLVYLLDGKRQEQAFAEKAAVELGSAEHPVEIVLAEYGRLGGAGGGNAIKVEAAVAEPSRVVRELKAVKLTEPRPGCYTFDLGQNMVGWVRLKVRGDSGDRITVRHGEMLNPDGTIYTVALRSCPAADFFVLSGKGEETLEPYFTFHGFRYVEVRGLKSRPALDAVTGLVVHTDMRRTGTFECSHPLLNQLYSNIIWGQKGNYLEVPTDCPQRDERMGWTGDTQFFAPTAAYNFDVASFFTRWLATCRDNQQPDGTFPHVVPDIMGGGGATGWGDAAILCTHNIYRAYGDTRIVAEQFEAMNRYMAWLAGRSKDGVTHVGGFGDWLNLGGGAAGSMIDTAYRAYLAGIMAEMARAIGREEDAARYAAQHAEAKAGLVKTFLKPDGSLKDCSQTGYALAFKMDLLPEDMRALAAAKFVDEIKRFDWHLATGFIGTPRLLPALHAAGRDDVAYRLLLQESYPSWLFPVKNGATTMWERWNGWTPQGFGDVSMNSFNHYAFGAVGEYLYGMVGGIQAASPGYKTIRIEPVAGEGLTWAKARFDSIHGPIACQWRREEGKLSIQATIPANTTAQVYVPARDVKAVTESGTPAERAEGVKFLKIEGGAAVFEVQSGHYAFEAAQ